MKAAQVTRGRCAGSGMWARTLSINELASAE